MSCRQHFLDPSWRRAAGAFLATCLLVAVPSTQAQPGQNPKLVAYDIPAQPLEAALQQVADKASLQLLYSPADLKGVSTRGLKGTHAPKEAIDRLIEGTGLTASFNGQNAVAIKPKAANERGGQAANPTLLAQAPSAERHEASDRPVQLEGIVVTAQKREERLIDVPSSVGVVTREEIERRGLVNAEDYLRGMPGASQVEGVFGQSIVIRGIETSPHLQNFFSGATTATYFGETPTTNAAGLGASTNVDLKLVDIERVEVLRGPQGTAFGSSSMGGTVRTLPVAPRLDRFEGSVAGGYSVTSGNGGDNFSLRAVGNFPIAEGRFAIRAVGYQYRDSGFYRNVAGSDPTFRTAVVNQYGAQAFAADEEEVGASEVRGGRIAALFRPSNDLRFTLSYLSQKNEVDGMPVASNGIYSQTIFQVAPQHVVRGQKAGVTDMEIDIANVMMQYDFGWAELLATFSRTESGSTQAYPFGAVGIHVPTSSTAFSDHRENVGELRLVTRLDGAWDFLAGLYAENLKDDAVFDNLWHGSPSSNIFGANTALGARVDKRSVKQKAAFGEVSWKFLPAVTLTGGARSYRYDRAFRVDASGALYGGAAGIHDEEDASASGTTYRANLSYKPNDDALLYGGWSQGFRLGQSQLGLPAGVCDLNGDGLVDGTGIAIDSTRRVNSDNVDSYELGAKFSSRDRRLSFAADVFRMEWTDVPVQVRPGSGNCIAGYVTNAGEALSEGVEFQLNFQVSPSFRIDFGGSYIKARLTQDVPALNARKGNRLPGSPKTNANLGVQYSFDILGRRGSARADATYVGAYYGDLLESPALKSGDYVKVDVSARMAVLKNLDLDLFVRNLTDEDAFTFRGIVASRAREYLGFRLRPRTIGVQLSYTF
jgi:iron complex outermembrane recepter protein